MRIVMLFLLLCVPFVSGLGVSPASMSFVGPDERNYSLFVLNHDPEPVSVRLSVIGVEEFVQVSEEFLTLSPGYSVYPVPVRLVVPAGAFPGAYAGGVVVEQLADGAGDGVAAIASVVHRVEVVVPNTGLFVRSSFVMHAPVVGEEFVFAVLVENVGTVPVASVFADVDVVDVAGVVVGSDRSSSVSLPVGEKRSLPVRWLPLRPGVYEARAVVWYDGRQLSLSQVFEVGSRELVLGTPALGPYRLGEVVRVDIPVASRWNEPLHGVSGSFAVSRDAAVLDAFTSLSTVVPAFGVTNVTGFWDTSGLDAGSYELSVVVRYGSSAVSGSWPVVLEEVVLQFPSSGCGWCVWMLFACVLAVLIILYFLSRKK